ncbi:MAG TPA: hypothetical protein VFM82_07820 [Flavobacteriaceae bacterium]|nr:hypothetical protein [Flavobacteriaceae bacterium]
MKISCILFLSLFMACNSTKKSNESINTALETSMECPKGGECTFSVMKNMAMLMKKDGTGMSYPEFVENRGTNVIKFRFHKESPQGMADGNYTEEVYMEIKDDVKNLSLKDEALQEVKLVFNRMCFCERGTVGYFPIIDGNLEYQRNSDSASVVLSFANNKVPQRLEKIAGEVSLE